MDPSLLVLHVLLVPSVQGKGTRHQLLVTMVSTPVVTPLPALLVKMGSYVRRERSEIVPQGKHVVEVLPVTAVPGTTLMVEGVLVNRVKWGSTTPRRRLLVRMTAPPVLLT